MLVEGINCDVSVLSNYQDDNNDENSGASSMENDDTSRMSRYIKGKSLKYGANGKIYFEVGQIFQSVYHFKKVLKDYNIQKGFVVERKYNELRRIKVVCTTMVIHSTYILHLWWMNNPTK